MVVVFWLILTLFYTYFLATPQLLKLLMVHNYMFPLLPGLNYVEEAAKKPVKILAGFFGLEDHGRWMVRRNARLYF